MTKKEYWNKVDKTMKKRRFELVMSKDPQTKNETRTYHMLFEYKKNDYYGILVEININEKFRFSYTNSQMFSILESYWNAEIFDDKCFNKWLQKFYDSVKALKDRWNDYE